MGAINSAEINDVSYLLEPTLFATTSGTSSMITAFITNFELIDGVAVILQITNTNTSEATLSINNSTPKDIYYHGGKIEADTLKQGHIYNLVYDGNVWHVIGENSSSTGTSLPHKLIFGAGGVYEYDGSADVTVPVYTGGII